LTIEDLRTRTSQS